MIWWRLCVPWPDEDGWFAFGLPLTPEGNDG
jgi:hypothetical protein